MTASSVESEAQGMWICSMGGSTCCPGVPCGFAPLIEADLCGHSLSAPSSTNTYKEMMR
jgi:hypothetical protein